MSGTGMIGVLQRGDVIVVPELPRRAPQLGGEHLGGRSPAWSGGDSGRGHVNLIDVIATAGGQTGIADLKRVLVTRVDAKTQESETTTVDLHFLISQSSASRRRAAGANLQVNPGDVVFVPERIL